MKRKCQVCGVVDESATEHTCPKCGESSWSEPEEEKTKSKKK